MTVPRQPAARARWSTRLEAIGLALAALREKAAPGMPAGSTEFKMHIATVSRVCRIPETTLRTMAAEAFTEIRVPGYVVGYGANYFYLAPAERR